MIDGNLAMNSHFDNMSEKDSNDMHDHYITLEGNRLIAEFMGGFLRDQGHGDMIWDHKDWSSPVICKSQFELEYHTNWSWLIAALKKAKEYLDKMDRPSQNHCCKGDLIEVDVQCHLWSFEIENTWKSFVEWLKWYNSQTPNK